MSAEPLYSVQVNGPDRGLLIQVTGRRETVIEAALNVILDSAPYWDESHTWPRPMFTVDVQRVTGSRR